MKFKHLRFSLFILAVLVAFISCEDDDGPKTTFQEKDRGEQQIADKDSILTYLASHYYNSSFFESGSNHKYTDIVITELEEGESVPSGHSLLLNVVETHYTEFLEFDYEYYVLKINQGGGESPKFTDAVRVRYEGTSVERNQVFDAISSPNALPLVGNGFNTFGTIRGWQLVLPMFNTAMNFNIDGNGIVNFENFGLGVMFVPSGLAYFSGTSTGSSYDNLIFKFELLQHEELDHDGDGIPSYVEDLNGDFNINNDDTDGDGLPNYVDVDDDGDGVSTFNELLQTVYTVNTSAGEEEPILSDNEYEISRSTNAGTLTITTVTALDTNNNGILDYLDDTVSINYNEVVN